VNISTARRSNFLGIFKTSSISVLAVLTFLSLSNPAVSAVHFAASDKRIKRSKISVSVEGSGTREAPADLDKGLLLNAHLRQFEGNQGSLENASDPCFGPSAPTYRTIDTRSIFGPPPPTAKPGVSTTAPKPIRMEKLVEVLCDGKRLRAFWKCLSTPTLPCPPVPVHFDPLGMAINLFLRKVVKFEPPEPDFYPKPSRVVPLVGVGFFYGVMQDQFDRVQKKRLTVCDSANCATVLLKAFPEEVHFDAGTGLGMKTTCDYAGPGVYNKADSKEAEDFCRVDYQSAGLYRTTMKMLYRIEVSVEASTIEQFAVLPQPATIYGTTTTVFNLTVHQRQPVVIG
jgi:hypothetical protein